MSEGSGINIAMAGAGGDGVIAAGEILIRALAAEGGYAMLSKSYGPQIRGGESAFRLRYSSRPVLTAGARPDLLFVLDWEDLFKFRELTPGASTALVYDELHPLDPWEEKLAGLGLKPDSPRLLAAPLDRRIREITGKGRGRNIMLLGMLAAWLGTFREALLHSIESQFQARGEELVKNNQAAFQAGYEFAREHPCPVAFDAGTPEKGTPLSLADGNSMCAAGAVYAGCEFFAGYPITPASEIMHFMSRELGLHDGVMLQAEDEIASIGAALGASFAGKKAMTATSGPGLDLQTEMLGLASIAELPLVLINVQRGGPSTGLPTQTEQSDLFQAVFGGHGDIARPVLAPWNAANSFLTSIEAFNIAETLQTPVILLSDQQLAQRKETFVPPDLAGIRIHTRRSADDCSSGDGSSDSYRRYELTPDGVSPFSVPGTSACAYQTGGLEHDEKSNLSTSGANHERMNRKRFEKLSPLQEREDLFDIEGPSDAPLGLIAWGSRAGAALEAARLAREEGLPVKTLVPRLLYPVVEKVYRSFFSSLRAGFVIEQSYQGQLFRLLRMYLDLPPGLQSLKRSGGEPIAVNEILEKLREAEI